MDAFPACCDIAVGHEGGFDAEPADPGNWTGGSVGAGLLRGTKYGISAASFPTLDIQGLTLDAARAIYRALYWTKLLCDQMPAELALLVFDSAVNNGTGAAARLLQRTLGVEQDGLLGPQTMGALARAIGDGSADRIDAVSAEFQARRVMLMTEISTWPTFGLGWTRRLVRLPFQALRLPAPAANDPLATPRQTAA